MTDAHKENNKRVGIVLVAAEHWKIATKKSWWGAHCSIAWVGKAYSTLIARYGRENIVTMGNLNKVQAFYERATTTDDFLVVPDVSESQQFWRDAQKAFMSDCEHWIRDGGADYDDEDVNPDNFMRILEGRPCAPGKRVLNVEELDTVMICLYSHGDKKNIENFDELLHRPCISCGNVHDLPHEDGHAPTHNIWVCHFPFPQPPPDVVAAVEAMTGSPPANFVPPPYIPRPNDLNSVDFWKMIAGLHRRNPDLHFLSVFQFCFGGGFMINQLPVSAEADLADLKAHFFAASGEGEMALAGVMDRVIRVLADESSHSLSISEAFAAAQEQYYAHEAAAIPSVVMLRDPCRICMEFDSGDNGKPLCSLCFVKHERDGIEIPDRTAEEIEHVKEKSKRNGRFSNICFAFSDPSLGSETRVSDLL